MAGLVVELNEHKIASMKGHDLNLQIEWYKCRHEFDAETGWKIVPPTSKLKVHEKKWLLYGLKARYKTLYGTEGTADTAEGTADIVS
jgi:hypothetical protein